MSQLAPNRLPAWRLAAFAALALVKEPPAPPPSPARSTLRRDLAVAARDPLLRKVLASVYAVTLGQLNRSSLFVFFVAA